MNESALALKRPFSRRCKGENDGSSSAREDMCGQLSRILTELARARQRSSEQCPSRAASRERIDEGPIREPYLRQFVLLVVRAKLAATTRNSCYVDTTRPTS